jgi:hypothetical protein
MPKRKSKVRMKKQKDADALLLDYINYLHDSYFVANLHRNFENKFLDYTENQVNEIEKIQAKLHLEIELLIMLIQVNRKYPLKSLGGVEYTEEGLFHTLEQVKVFIAKYQDLKKELMDARLKYYDLLHNFKKSGPTVSKGKRDLKQKVEDFKKFAAYDATFFDKVIEKSKKTIMDPAKWDKKVKLDWELRDFFQRKYELLKDYRYHSAADKGYYI